MLLAQKKIICSAVRITLAPNDGFVPCFGGLLRLALRASGADGHRQQWLQNTNAGAGSHKAPLLKNALAIQCPCTMLSNRRAEAAAVHLHIRRKQGKDSASSPPRLQDAPA